MKSNAHIKGHPIHPMLIVFPIAFFTGTLFFDVLAYIFDNGDFWHIAKYLSVAAIVMALIAAVPGIIDFKNTVPPKSSAKSRAAKHGILNVTNVLLFGVALYYRLHFDEIIIVIALEAAGFILMTIAGWMGGTLVYRNQIGVNPRYANAGKWKELKIAQASGHIEVADVDELETGQMKLVITDNNRIVIAKTETGYAAFDDHCPHRGGSLAGGMLIRGGVQCPWHGSQFDVCTGEVQCGPASKGINIYAVKEENNKVYLML